MIFLKFPSSQHTTKKVKNLQKMTKKNVKKMHLNLVSSEKKAMFFQLKA